MFVIVGLPAVAHVLRLRCNKFEVPNVKLYQNCELLDSSYIFHCILLKLGNIITE